MPRLGRLLYLYIIFYYPVVQLSMEHEKRTPHTHTHTPTFSPTHEGKKSPGGSDESEKIDLRIPPEFVHREPLHGAQGAHPCVVHQAPQPLWKTRKNTLTKRASRLHLFTHKKDVAYTILYTQKGGSVYINLHTKRASRLHQIAHKKGVM